MKIETKEGKVYIIHDHGFSALYAKHTFNVFVLEPNGDQFTYLGIEVDEKNFPKFIEALKAGEDIQFTISREERKMDLVLPKQSVGMEGKKCPFCGSKNTEITVSDAQGELWECFTCNETF